MRLQRHQNAAPAPEEQVLNIYNWADYIGYHTIAEFERATQIKVVYQMYDSNETLEANLMAGHSGFDIVSTTTGFYARQIRAGAYLPLDKAKLPNWKNLDPAVLAIQAQADPGNRYAVPYLHAMNGFVYNVDMIKARMPDAPTDSLAMIFKPEVIAKFADCGVTFLDSSEDVIQLALAYLHRDPNSRSAEDLNAAEQSGHGGATLHSHLRFERLLASIGVEGNMPRDRLVKRLFGRADPGA